MQVILAPLP